MSPCGQINSKLIERLGSGTGERLISGWRRRRLCRLCFLFGGAYGEGVLLERGHYEYYNSFTGSWGLQAGAQSYGYAVFLMNDKAVDYVHKTDGWEIGVGPTVVIVDAGAAKNLSTSTLKDDAYAFIFDQKGLMAGVALEGTKISHIRPDHR